MMSIQEVANRLVELCRAGQSSQAREEFYTEESESFEPERYPNARTQGLSAIRQKDEEWFNSVEQLHSAIVGEPIIAGNFFSVAMTMDIKLKDSPRMTMEEIALYEVKDGKIITERFFY
ncbi:MAG: nuclear transport factor 2 family protein [Microscillaceae bacterium]|jgi:hypothetical protein|nr:nuclear transport factor 2 family protein [Microscillaceae bacterium]